STLLATGGAEGLVTLWAVGNTLRYVKLKGHTGSITYLAFFPDGKTLGSASNDGTVRIWDLTSPQESRTLGMLPGKYEGRHIAYSPDGRWLAVAGDPAGLWDARTGLLIRQFGAAYRVAFSPDGKTLATGGEDSRLQIWDVGTKQLIRTLGVKPHEPDMPRNTVGALSFSPDGKLLAAGFGWRQWFVNEDHEQWARIWDWTSGREIARLPHKNTVAGLAFSPDGHLLATASHDRGVRLWSVASWRQTRHWNGPDTFDSVAFAPGGGILAAGGGDGLIRLWKVDSGAALPPLNGHSNHVMDLAFAPDGKTLASASWDRTLKLWDVTSGRALRSIGHANQLQAVAFARDGKTLVSSGIDMVHFWDTLSSIQREQEALAQLTELLSQRPDDIDAYLSRARIYLTREQWAEAFRDTNRAVELHPNNLNARLLRAPVLTHMRQWDKALADYAFIRARGLTNAPLRTQYGDLLGLTEKWTEAAAVFGQLAEEKASSYSMPWYSGYRQAVALAAAGKDEEYRRACQRMFDRFHDTDDLQAAWFTAWGCALKPGALADYGPVLQLAQRALARNSESSRSHDIVGALLYRAGKHEEARRELEAADNTADWAVTSPAYCWYYLAMVHFRLGHKQDGEKWYQRAATQTDQELKDWTNKAEPALWVRKASLQVLHREAEALRRESVR
ncbi:MAG TPA: hypothetical protein VG013_43010, partial [Gemmataceae bacterium]|nr:hypothetical protein [Gemmataceae bacterium]